MEFYDYLFGQEKKYGEIRHITVGLPVDPNEQSRVQAIEGIEDKKRAVTGGDDGRLHLWNIEILATDVLPKVFP